MVEWYISTCDMLFTFNNLVVIIITSNKISKKGGKQKENRYYYHRMIQATTPLTKKLKLKRGPKPYDW